MCMNRNVSKSIQLWPTNRPLTSKNWFKIKQQQFATDGNENPNFIAK